MDVEAIASVIRVAEWNVRPLQLLWLVYYEGTSKVVERALLWLRH